MPYYPTDQSKLHEAAAAIRQAQEDAQARREGGGFERIPEYVWRKTRKNDQGYWDEATVNILRVLPAWSPELAARGVFGRVSQTHFNIPPDGKVFLCMARTYPELGIDCHLCNLIQEMSDLYGDLKYEDYGLDQILTGRGRKGHLNILDMNPSPPVGWSEKNPKHEFSNSRVLSCVLPVSVYNWIMLQADDPMVRADGEMVHPYKGFNIRIYKTGSGMGTTYECLLNPQGRTPIAASQQEIEKILGDLHDLDKEIYLRPLDKERIEASRLAANAARTYFVNRATAAREKIMAGSQSHQTPPPPPASAQPPNQPPQTTPPVGSSPVSPPAETSPQGPPPAPAASPSPAPSPTVGDAPRNERPPCFGGAAPRPGTDKMGHDPNDASCWKCAFEIACGEQCRANGIGIYKR